MTNEVWNVLSYCRSHTCADCLIALDRRGDEICERGITQNMDEADARYLCSLIPHAMLDDGLELTDELFREADVKVLEPGARANVARSETMFLTVRRNALEELLRGKAVVFKTAIIDEDFAIVLRAEGEDPSSLRSSG